MGLFKISNLAGRLILLISFFVFINVGLDGQNCLTKAFTSFIPGECRDIPNDSCSMNFYVKPDFKTDLYNYRIISPLEFNIAQSFGATVFENPGLDTLRCRLFTPLNNESQRPVILLSSLSSFASANIYSYVTDYIASYFAKKGYSVIVYQSRRFQIRGYEMLKDSMLSDYISNPYYLSDTAVLNDFKKIVRENTNPFSTYSFLDLLKTLSKADNGQQLVFDAYLEMIFKISNDTRYLMKLVKAHKGTYKFHPDYIFLMGGSAAAVQSLHAGLLSNPEDIAGYLDSTFLPYKGLSYPNEGSLSMDFQYEPDLTNTPNAKGIINLWGFISTLDMIKSHSPSIFSVHGSWDDVFSYQLTFQEDMQLYFGYGSEAIFHKASLEGIHTDLYTVCKGKHALYPLIDSCSVKFSFQENIFKDYLSKINFFLMEHMSVAYNDIYAVSMPWNFATTLPKTTLVPPASCNYIDSNSHCPVIFPDHFSTFYLPPLNQINAEKRFTNIENQDIKQSKESIEISVSPNPSAGNLLLEISFQKSHIVDIIMSDTNSKIVKTIVLAQHFVKGRHQLTIDTRNISPGIYHISVNSRYGMIETKRLVVF